MAKRPRDSVEREIMDIIPERFDADAGSMEARRGAHSRVILTIALALLALAAIGIAARLLFVGNGQQIAADATVPVIKADDKPIKTKPEDRGGMDVPNQDKLIYNDVGKAATSGAAGDKLAPPPEKPQAPPAKVAINSMPAAGSDLSVPPPPPAVASTDKSDMPAPAASQPAAPSAAASSKTVSSAPLSAATPATKPAMTASAAPAAAAPAAAKPATAASAAPAPAASAPPAAKANAPAPAAPKANTPASGGGWQVQVAAMKSQADADAAWKKALAANKELLGSLPEEIVQVDLGAKGVYYRVRVGPMDEAAAKTLCAELTKRNQGCIVARK
jgi:cell division septation protein DedD